MLSRLQFSAVKKRFNAGWLVVRARGPMQKSYQFGSGLATRVRDAWIQYWSDSDP